MKRILSIYLLSVLLTSCGGGGDKNGGENQDSISKVQQKHVSDSLKKDNPLLILPPDSTYTGDYIDKYPTGVIKFRGQFRFGQRHGHWLSFYPDGKLWSEMEYDKGLRQGQNITYFENGKVRYSGFYQNDMKDSVWVFYDEGGNPSRKVEYKAGRIVRQLPANSSH